jgi:hypothetical protein
MHLVTAYKWLVNPFSWDITNVTYVAVL